MNELTRRERDVMALVARGMTNEQIADELAVSVITVKHHMTNICEKLGVHNRTHALVVALERGIVRVGDEDRAGRPSFSDGAGTGPPRRQPPPSGGAEE